MQKVLIYTVHKAGSMFLHEISREIAEELKIRHISINDDRYSELIVNRSWKSIIANEPPPSCFGPIRASEAVPNIPDNLEDYSVLLHLRDPRDALVSLYFSNTYSHPVGTGFFNPPEGRREAWEKMGVDKFVLRQAARFNAFYKGLCSALLDNESVICLKYETMVTDYGKWLKQYLSAFYRQMSLFQKLLARFTTSGIYKKLYHRHKDAFAVASENIYAHKRQILPGDHTRKLHPETIIRLNEEFRDILQILDYEKKFALS